MPAGAQPAPAPPDRCADRRTRRRRPRPDRRRAAAAGWRRGRSSAPSCRPRRPARRARASGTGSAPPSAVGDALIDRGPGRPAGGRRAHARERSGVERAAGQHAADAVLVAVAAAPLLVDAADHDQVGLVRRRAAQDRRQREVGLAPVGVQRVGSVPLGENITTKRLTARSAARARPRRHRLEPGQRDRRAAGAAQDRPPRQTVRRIMADASGGRLRNAAIWTVARTSLRKSPPGPASAPGQRGDGAQVARGLLGCGRTRSGTTAWRRSCAPRALPARRAARLGTPSSGPSTSVPVSLPVASTGMSGVGVAPAAGGVEVLEREADRVHQLVAAGAAAGRRCAGRSARASSGAGRPSAGSPRCRAAAAPADCRTAARARTCRAGPARSGRPWRAWPGTSPA